MIQAFLTKKLVEKIFGKVFKAILIKYDLDSFKNYVENENELDIKVKELEDRIIKLERDSHPVADFVCTEHGCKATRMESEFKEFKAKEKIRRMAL